MVSQISDAAESQCIVPLICNGNPSWVPVPNKETFSLPQDPTKEREMCNDLLKQAQDGFNTRLEEMKGMMEEFQRMLKDKTKMTSTTTKLIMSEKATSSTSIEAATISTILTMSEAATMFTIPTTSEAETTSTIPTTSEAEATSTIPTTSEATSTIPTTSEATEHVKSTCAELSGIQWNGKCFWVNVTSPVRINYPQAAEICEEQNSHPANIYNNSTHYDQVMTYLRSNIPEGRIWIWLGMTINPSTKVISLYNGTTTNYEWNWHTGYPSSGTSFTQMVVAVDKDPGSKYQGMFNYPPSDTVHGILCEIELNSCIISLS